jgi:O-antigen ligase
MQYQTGKFRGLMLDKGAGSERLDYQYSVPGIEGLSRATGTSYDSHSLGLYLAMLLPYPFVFLPYSRYVSWSRRIVSGGVFLLGVATLLITFSRSGWLSAAIALCLALLVLLAWHGRHAVSSVLVLLGLSLLPLPWAASRIHERFDTAPPEIMTARFDQFSVALHMWRDHPFFGFGAGNYMKALDLYNTNGSLDLPVHNVLLWIAADTGLLGVLAFYGIIVSALRRLWILIRQHRDPDCRMALAVATGLVAYVLDGLTNPLFREATVYMMFWLLIAMSVVLPRLQRKTRNVPAHDALARELLVRTP